MGAEHEVASHSHSHGHEPHRLKVGPAGVHSAPASFALSDRGGMTSHAVLALQRSHGNAFVERRLTAVQRHPEGFTPTVDPEEAAAEIANPPPLAAVGGGGDEETADPAAAEDVPSQEADDTAPTETVADDTAAEADPAVAPATGSGEAKAPATPTAMSLAKAEDVLTKSFGTVKKIVPGKIELLADRAALWVKYDQINKGRKNPYNGGKPWKDGDAKQYIPGLDGTADPDTGIVYINQQTRLATATAHEVLHNNTAAGFRTAVGDTINEGTTEYLAIKALKAASVSTTSGTAYPGEVAFVTKLIGVVTEDCLIKAYFGGAATLTDAFDKKQGAGAFAKMKPFADAKNYTEAEKALKAP